MSTRGEYPAVRLGQARDEIERLRAINAELLEALEEYLACVLIATAPANRQADVITLVEVHKRMEAARSGAQTAIARAKGEKS